MFVTRAAWGAGLGACGPSWCWWRAWPDPGGAVFWRRSPGFGPTPACGPATSAYTRPASPQGGPDRLHAQAAGALQRPVSAPDRVGSHHGLTLDTQHSCRPVSADTPNPGSSPGQALPLPSARVKSGVPVIGMAAWRRAFGVVGCAEDGRVGDPPLRRGVGPRWGEPGAGGLRRVASGRRAGLRRRPDEEAGGRGKGGGNQERVDSDGWRAEDGRVSDAAPTKRSGAAAGAGK